MSKPAIHPREFLDAIDDEKVITAIHNAEARCNTIIRVHVSHQSEPDATTAAGRLHKRVKLHKPTHNGCVLIFVAPKSRTFAIEGDKIAHAALGDSGWNAMTELLMTHFKAGDFTGGLIATIEKIADQLASPPPQAE